MILIGDYIRLTNPDDVTSQHFDKGDVLKVERLDGSGDPMLSVYLDDIKTEAYVYLLSDEYEVIKEVDSDEEMTEDTPIKNPYHHKQSCFDVVNKAEHYNKGIEVIEFVESWDLNFNLGNVIKYSCRSGIKYKSKTIEDLKKAEYYIKREISRLEKECK